MAVRWHGRESVYFQAGRRDGPNLFQRRRAARQLVDRYHHTTPPAQDVDVSADFEVEVPVRFDTDHMAVTIGTCKLHRWQQIPIVELRP
jgi:hypothetical protein